jgi:hypothetical protein
MTRRKHIALLGTVAVAIGSPASGKESETMKELFEASQNEKKGLMLYVKGQTIPGIVVKIGADFVELRSREYGRIVIRIDSIDAAAMA